MPDELSFRAQALTRDQRIPLDVVRLAPGQEDVRLVDQKERVPCFCQIEPVLELDLCVLHRPDVTAA